MAVSVQIVAATRAHAEQLAPRMRPAEAAEVRAAGGYTPLAALLDALAHSDVALSALFDGEVACMWGVAGLRRSAVQGRVGAVWLLTSDLIERHPVAFWRGCKEEVLRLFSEYDVLVNAIDARHAQALRWARRLGFPLEEPKPFGVERRPFCFFRVRKEDLRV